MNISLIVVGLTIFFGSVLTYHALQKSRATLIGFGMFAAGGLGTILVGLFPENTVAALHVLGATLPFLVGNAGLVILGFALPVPKWLRVFTLLTGLVALIALVAFNTHTYGSLGLGGLERIVAYPQTIWMIVMGLYGVLRRKERF